MFHMKCFGGRLCLAGELLLPGRFAKIFGGPSRSKAGLCRIAGRCIVQFPDQKT